MKKKTVVSTKVCHPKKRVKLAQAKNTQKKPLPKLKEDENGKPICDAGLDLLRTAAIEATGTGDFDAAGKMIDDIVCTFFRNEENKTRSFNQSLSLLNGISPRDELEGMLAAQMIGTYNLAMLFMANAILNEQPSSGIDINVNRANKLLRTFTTQMEALTRYRGKGQKMTVEHVHVHEGGQAIVGDVHHQGEG